MKLVLLVGNKIKFFQTQNLKSSIIWPLFEPGLERQFCVKYVNVTKTLRNDISWLQKLASGNDLRLLYKYELIASDIIFTLDNLKKKKVIRHKDYIIISSINRLRVLNYLTERVIVRMGKSKACDKFIHQLLIKIDRHSSANSAKRSMFSND